MHGDKTTRVVLFNPISGIWTITIYGDVIVEGIYHAWLPISGLATSGLQFVNSNPNYTIVGAATGLGTITTGGYNNINGALCDTSSWGPNRILVNRPDLVAPGVNITGIYPDNRQGIMTGTSAAAAILTGACSLMLQWGIVERNNVELNTYRIRPFLIRGALRDSDIKYPSNQWGYGKLNLINTFNLLRP